MLTDVFDIQEKNNDLCLEAYPAAKLALSAAIECRFKRRVNYMYEHKLIIDGFGGHSIAM